MFRIQTQKNNVNLYNKNCKGWRGFKYFFTSGVLLKSVIAIAVVIVGYGVWTHGTFSLQAREEAILAAQIKSPLPPEWLQRYFKIEYCSNEDSCGPEADPDKDGLTNYEEFLFFTDPKNSDTNADGMSDGDSVKNYVNPIGTGPLQAPRDINNPYEYNPLADELVESSLEEIQKGNVMTFEQINEAAAKLADSDLPQFYEIPFTLNENNTQEGVKAYLDALVQATDTYRANEAVQVGAEVIDTLDINQITQYSDAVALYATTLVFISTPNDLFKFHKSFYGSLVFQGLIADTQKEFLEGKLDEENAQARMRTYTIYFTRFLQDTGVAAEVIKQKYDFPFDFVSQQQNSNQ